MTKWNNNTKFANHTDMMKVVLTGKEQSARFTRGYGSFRMGPFVKGPQQCFNCKKFSHHDRTCRSEVQTCRYCAGRHHSHQCKDNKQRAKENGRREERKDCTTVTTNHTQTGQKGTSCYTTDKHIGHIDRIGSGEIAIFMPTINSHNHSRNHRATNGSTYKTIKPNNKELNFENNAEQKVGKGKGGTRPTTKHQCMDKAVRTINERFSGSYVSEQDKTVPFSQSMPINQQATNTTPTNRRGTNGRCTRSNTHCTHRSNITTQEDFYREHLSSTCTQENNGGRH